MNMVALSSGELSGELGQFFILKFLKEKRGYCQYKPPGKLFHNLKMFLYFCSKHLKTVALSLFLLQGAFPAYRTRDTRSRVRPSGTPLGPSRSCRLSRAVFSFALSSGRPLEGSSAGITSVGT